MDECGQPENNAVLCDSNEGYDSGIKYEGKTNGLTLTVRPSTSTTITSTPPSGSLPTAYSGGVHLEGGGTLKVVLDGDVSVVNGAPRTLVDHTVSGPPSRTVKVIAPAGVNAYRTSGIYVLHEENKAGEIGIEIGEGARIGMADQLTGMYGAFAHFEQGTGDIKIVNRGMVYGHYRGIQAEHAGAGNIAIETARGSVTLMGIRASSGTGGNVEIQHHGRVEIRQPIRYKKTDGTLDDISVSTHPLGVIDVVHNDSTTGTNESPSSAVTVVSSGDLVVDTADWERYAARGYAWRASGIKITSKGDEDSVVPITVDVTGGTITADGRTSSHGVHVHSEHRGGLVKVDFAGTIARTGPDGDGINVYRELDVLNAHATIKESDIKVTLKPGARIGVDGDESTVGRHGVQLNQEVAVSGSIEMILKKGARIGTEETPVGGEGVWSRIASHRQAGDIRVTNLGQIHAKGSGVYVWHQGKGDVVVKHEMGKIVAGDKVGEFGSPSEEDPLPDWLQGLKSKTAGIFAFHGGSEIITNADGATSARIGEIRITSKADIASDGDGVFAYVNDPDLARDNVEMMIPITVEVSGGMIMAKGAGIHAETATMHTDKTKAGKIAVTVGEAATVEAEKDGVYVAGKRVFASDHVRAGEYDQKVTIHGKVTGGGGEHAGVRMVKGGTLMIGARAEIGAGSEMAVKSTGKLTITMEKDVRGRIAWIQDKFVNTADMTIFKGVSVGDTVTATSGVKTRGVYEGGMERRVTLEKTTEDSLDTYQFKQESAREFREYHARARVYEALPSVLLDLNRQTSAHARLSARRDGNGGWARVWFGDGEREADRSTTEGGLEGRALAWDFEYWGAEMGFDVPTSTEGLLLGVSAHYRDGEADVEHGGRIDASGFGFGVSATYRAEEGLYVDGQVSYTRFDDIDLGSDARGRLASGLDGDGYAVGLEVGRRMEMAEREVVLTPRGGLVWSSVDVDGFEDVKVEGYAGDRRVSFGSEDSFQGRVGVLAESMDGRIYASLDVEHEFSEDRDVTASGARLESEPESTWARLGFGGSVELDETGQAALSGQGFYALADGDNRDYGASVTLRARF